MEPECLDPPDFVGNRATNRESSAPAVGTTDFAEFRGWDLSAWIRFCWQPCHR